MRQSKPFVLVILLAAVFLLSACKRVIESPADELRLYSWRCEEENGCVVSLSFDELVAALSIDGGEYSLSLSGLSVVTDDKLTICDEDSGMDYTFGYRLFGDRIELSYDESTITLKKTDNDR